MTRIDHAAEAQRRVRSVLSTYQTGEDAGAIVVALVGLTDATLALTEQQKIANLIALAKIAGREEDVHEEVAEVAYEALNALVHLKVVPNGHMDPNEVTVLRPEIAAALGIKQS